jgi:tetratricopeptide (TPR) repeat protein
MAEKQVTVEAVETNELLEKAKGFWAQFSKPIIYLGSLIILGTGGWLLYKNFVLIPKEEKAAELIFPAEKLFDKMVQQGFNKDSINLVLNGGNGISTGMLKIISNYSGTTSSNRAHFIAGACYLHNKDFNNAIKHLNDFTTGATQVQTAAYLMLGDANAELKKNDDAYSFYKKAASLNTKDEFMTPEALFKSALFAENIGKTEDAISFFQKIKEEYPKSSHANEVDKYLARLGVIK